MQNRRNQEMKKRALRILLGLGMCFTAQAADIYRANVNTNNIESGAAWSNGVAPTATDVAVFGSGLNPAMSTNALGADVSWQGIRLTNISRAVTINGTTPTITLGSAGIDMTQVGFAFNINPNVDLDAPQTWSVTNTKVLTVNGVLSGGAANTLIKDDLGILTLAGTNTYSGGTILNAGKLMFGNNVALGNGPLTINGGVLDASKSLTNSNNNAQNWNGDFSFTGSSGLNIGSGAVTLGGNRTVTVDANILTVGGIIDDGVNTYSLTKAGAGTLTLTNANTYGGGTFLNAGKLQVEGHNGVLGFGNFTIAGSSLVLQSLLGTTLTNDIDLASTDLLISVGLNKMMTLSGVITNTGSLTKIAAGALTLSGANSSSGGMTLTAGILNLYNAQALGTGGLTINGGTIGGNGAVTTNAVTINADFTLTGNSGASIAVFAGPVTLGTSGGTSRTITSSSVNSGTGSPAFQGVISDGTTATKIIKKGQGGLSLSGANDFTGGVDLDEGVLIGKADGALGTGDITVGSATTNLIATLILTNGVSNNYINDTAMLILHSNTVLSLDFTGADTVGGISLDGGATWLPAGTYDASALNSAGGNGVYNGTGSLTIVSGPSSYTLTGSAGANGTVTPSSTNVPSGSSADFVITADSLYRIASLTTNGTPVTGMLFDNNSTTAGYTWSNVLADGTLAATFTDQLATNNIPYSWLAQYGLTNFDTDAVADQDADGLLAWQEYITGTNPTNPASGFRVTENPRNVLSWSPVSGRLYAVYWSTNLLNGFTCLVSNIPSTQTSYTNTTTVQGSYYKLDVRLQ
jgi:autotransporter-associated beta strand protein